MAAPTREEAVNVSDEAYGIVHAVLAEVPEGSRFLGQFDRVMYSLLFDVDDPLVHDHIRMDGVNHYSPTLLAIGQTFALGGLISSSTRSPFEVKRVEYHKANTAIIEFDEGQRQMLRELGKDLLDDFCVRG